MRTNNNRIVQSQTTSTLRLLMVVFSSVLAGILAENCVYPFDPGIDRGQGMLVIEGAMIKGEKVQTIRISRSTDYNEPQFLPESGYLVYVTDDRGNQFSFTETSGGIYTAEIPDAMIPYNASYQMFLTSPDNKNYESTSEILLQDAPVDSVYYAEELNQTASSGVLEGIRFYADLKAGEENSRNYRWIMEETWEYHRKYPMELRWNGTRRIREKLPDNSDTLITCWITRPVEGFYNASTVNLQTNEKKRIPLNYVSNLTHRLEIKYSLLIRQYPLSDGAYHYFSSKKSEIQESGGLYDVQPVQNQSNIINCDDPDEKILGYFWASSFSEKRIFVDPPFNFVLFRYCQPSTIDWQSINRSRSTISFYITMIDGMEYTAEDMCFDCTQTGGKLKKPIFWE